MARYISSSAKRKVFVDGKIFAFEGGMLLVESKEDEAILDGIISSSKEKGTSAGFEKIPELKEEVKKEEPKRRK